MRVQGSRLLLQATLFRDQKNYKNQKRQTLLQVPHASISKLNPLYSAPSPFSKKAFNSWIMINKIIHMCSVNYHNNYIKLAYPIIFEECWNLRCSKVKTLPQIFIITHETKQSYKLPFLKKRFSKNLFPASTEWEDRENYELSPKLTMNSVIASINRFRWYNSKELQNSFLSFYRYLGVYCENTLRVH